MEEIRPVTEWRKFNVNTFLKTSMQTKVILVKLGDQFINELQSRQSKSTNNGGQKFLERLWKNFLSHLNTFQIFRCSILCTSPLPPPNNVAMKKLVWDRVKCTCSPTQTTTLLGEWGKRGEITADHVNCPKSFAPHCLNTSWHTKVPITFWNIVNNTIIAQGTVICNVKGYIALPNVMFARALECKFKIIRVWKRYWLWRCSTFEKNFAFVCFVNNYIQVRSSSNKLQQSFGVVPENIQ